MKSDILLAENDKITQIIKAIFGDVCQNVYVRVFYYPDSEIPKLLEEETRITLENLTPFEFCDKHNMGVGDISVVVEFTNGKKVLYWVSEYECNGKTFVKLL